MELDLNSIKEVFLKRTPSIIGKFKKSAVMILLEKYQEEVYIIFEVRAKTLRHQPGDICLPGGKMEENENSKETAIRETLEELNLEREDLEYIAPMDYFISPYGSIMYPHIALLMNKDIKPNISEVDHIFKVPLSYFKEAEPKCYPMNIGPRFTEDFPFHLIKKGKDYKFSNGTLNQFFYQYEEYVIWGFTALIIKSFVDILKSKEFHI